MLTKVRYMVDATTQGGGTHPNAAVVGGPLWLLHRIEKGETLPLVEFKTSEVEAKTNVVMMVVDYVVGQMKDELFVELAAMIA